MAFDPEKDADLIRQKEAIRREKELIQKLEEENAAQSVSHRCMGKTCGFAAVLAATAATAAGPRGRNPISESTVKQSEK